MLVGLMGAGKTTVGRRVAERLGVTFTDTDELVEALAGVDVAEIFATRGEEHFRALERRAVADACAAPEPGVVACGGGAVVDPENRRQLRDRGLVVWLTAPVEVLAARVGAGAHRPLLATEPATVLRRLETLRGDAYAAAADVRVDTAGRDVEEVVDAVLAAAREEPAR